MKRPDAYWLFVVYTGLSWVLFSTVFTANLVYQVNTVGLNPLQLVLVGTTLEASVFLFEVPTGIVADVYSRRLSVIIGTFLIGAGFVLEGSIPRFVPILAAQVLWGIGYTFTSGAAQAWIADESGEERAGPAFVRAAQAGQAGSFVGILASMALGSLRINLPIVLGGALFVALGVFLIVAMPEHNFRPAPREGRSTAAHMAETLRAGLKLVRLKPVLFTIFGVSLFFGLSAEGFDRLFTAHLIRDIGLPTWGGFQPVVWTGAIDASALLLGVALTEFARRHVDMSSSRGPVLTLMISFAVTVVATIMLGLTGSFVAAVAMLWLMLPVRELIEPYHLAWLNRQLESEVRATAISMNSQMYALGQIVGGPLAGLLATAVSIPAAMVASGLVLAPSVLLCALGLRHEAPPLAAVALELVES